MLHRDSDADCLSVVHMIKVGSNGKNWARGNINFLFQETNH